MLARALARRREMGIRLAVGASRVRLLRQLLVENSCSSIAGGALGLVARSMGDPAAGHDRCRDQAPRWTTSRSTPGWSSSRSPRRVATAVLFGWAPALHAMNTDVRGAMRARNRRDPRRRSAGRRTLWALVVAEFALASLMFVCGGLLVRAYDRVRNTDPGFDPIDVLTFSVALPGATTRTTRQRLAFRKRLIERLRALPGVERAGLDLLRPGQRLPLGRRSIVAEGAPPRAPGRTEPDHPQPRRVAGLLQGDGHSAEGRPLLQQQRRHRRPRQGQRHHRQRDLCEDVLAGRSRRSASASPGANLRRASRFAWLTVVGVAKDVKHYGLERPVRPGRVFAA